MALTSREMFMCAILLLIRLSHKSVNTVLPVSACNVAGPTNLQADSVITVCTSISFFTRRRATSAALYAAIPPVIPRSRRLVWSEDDVAIAVFVRYFPREQDFNLKMNFFLKRSVTF